MAPQSFNWSQDRHFILSFNTPAKLVHATFMLELTCIAYEWKKCWIFQEPNFHWAFHLQLKTVMTDASASYLCPQYTSLLFLSCGLALRSTEYCRTARFITNWMPGCILIAFTDQMANKSLEVMSSTTGKRETKWNYLAGVLSNSPSL